MYINTYATYSLPPTPAHLVATFGSRNVQAAFLCPPTCPEIGRLKTVNIQSIWLSLLERGHEVCLFHDACCMSLHCDMTCLHPGGLIPFPHLCVCFLIDLGLWMMASPETVLATVRVADTLQVLHILWPIDSESMALTKTCMPSCGWRTLVFSSTNRYCMLC